MDLKKMAKTGLKLYGMAGGKKAQDNPIVELERKKETDSLIQKLLLVISSLAVFSGIVSGIRLFVSEKKAADQKRVDSARESLLKRLAQTD